MYCLSVRFVTYNSNGEEEDDDGYDDDGKWWWIWVMNMAIIANEDPAHYWMELNWDILVALSCIHSRTFQETKKFSNTVVVRAN